MSEDRLKSYERRLDALYEQRAEVNEDIAAVYAELKSDGYDPRAMRQAMKRKRIRPEDRAAADATLGIYEDALGISSPDAEPKADMSPRRVREFKAPANATSEEQLKAIIFKILEMRAERKDMGKAIQTELRKARAIGFSPVKINETCQWLERCDQHGRDKMMQAEELYMIYREIGEGPQAAPEVSGDSKLVAMFASGPAAPAKAPTLKQKQVGDAIAMAQIARMNRGRP